MERLPSLTALRAFEATVRTGSVKDAARDLCVSVGAVSQQLRRLEQDLGARLFRRIGRSLVATAQANAYAREIGQAFALIASASERVKDQQSADPLMIHTLPSIAIRLIVPALAEFRAHAPHVRVSFTYVHQPSEFVLGSADVLLCTVDGPSDKVGRVQTILDGAVYPVCSPCYRAALSERLEASELLQANLLHDCDSVGWSRWFEDAGVQAPGELLGDTYEDFGLMGAAALAGQGVALCPIDLIADELRRGELVLLSDVSTRRERRYCVVLPTKPHPDAEAFADWAISVGKRAMARDVRPAIGRSDT